MLMSARGNKQYLMSGEISYISLVLEFFGLDLFLVVIFSYTTERCNTDYACGVVLF